MTASTIRFTKCEILQISDLKQLTTSVAEQQLLQSMDGRGRREAEKELEEQEEN